MLAWWAVRSIRAVCSVRPFSLRSVPGPFEVFELVCPVRGIRKTFPPVAQVFLAGFLFDTEQRLTEFDRVTVFHQNFHDATGLLRRNFVEHFHSLNDADDRVGCDR